MSELRRLEYRITYPLRSTDDLSGETQADTTFSKQEADSLTRYLSVRSIPYRVEDRVWTASEWV